MKDQAASELSSKTMPKRTQIIVQELPEDEMKLLNKMLGVEDKTPPKLLKRRIKKSWSSRLFHKIEKLRKNLKIK